VTREGLAEKLAPSPVPRRLRISAAEDTITAWADRLLTGEVELWQLPPALLSFFEYGYIAGAASRQAEVDRISWTADRLYLEVCRRPPAPFIDRPSYADLEQTRHEIYYRSELDKSA